MQVVILATDEQRTLPPLTDSLPGPMLPIVARPVMATTVEIVARAGYKQILVSLYERGGQIASYFGGGRRWGVDIQYVTQREGWGTAGALRWAGSLLSGTCLALPGDVCCDLDLEAAYQAHRAQGGVMTVVLHKARASHNAYTVLRGGDGRLHSVEPTTAAQAGDHQITGAFLFEPEVLRYIPQGERYDLVADLLPALIAAGEPVYSYLMEGYWNPLNSLAAYQEAQQVYLYSAYYQRAPEQASGGPVERVRHPSFEARHIAPGIWVGRDHSISPSVKLAAPVYIGHNSWIGREVELGAGTVVGDDVVIDDEATISGSTILSGTYVGRLVNVEQKIVTSDSISDPEAEASTRIVDPFLIGRVDAAAEGRSNFRLLMNWLVAAAIFVLLSPLFVLVGLVVLITTGGQIFVRELRVGQRVGGVSGSLRTFQMICFRTRRANGSFTLGGRLIERWDLHRLPQLLNILQGDMSLIGVKPLRPEEEVRLTEDWHQRRHEAPAGFTGLWYIQTDVDSDLDTIIVTDVYYAVTRSWRGDLLLLLRTPGAWLRRGKSNADRPQPVDVSNV